MTADTNTKSAQFGFKDFQPRVLFYVQHLLGIGHVFRATRVARAMAKAGFQMHLVWGGTRLPSINLDGLNMIWLDPVKAGDPFIVDLVRPDGSPAGDALLERRRESLLGLLATLRPDIVMTETFPFGRRQMRFELEPLMKAARDASWRPLTISSIRDIMTENRKQSRLLETLHSVKSWYDLVLVHGDERLISLPDTLPGAETIMDKVRYTGLVAPEPVDMSIPPSISADVVISAGGGAVGHALTAAAIGANKHSSRFPDNWLLVVGPERADSDFEVLETATGQGMRIVRFVPDLARVLAESKVSVSRAGYNTVGDLMRAGCRSVLAPFSGGRETEQLRRARMLADRGLCQFITDQELTPQTLGAAVDRAAEQAPMNAGFDLEGAANSARIIRELFESRCLT